MKRLILNSFITTIAFTQIANADAGVKLIKQIKVAVIDTGIDPELMKHNFICKNGHKDFTGTGLADSHGHGTHISGIIDQYAKNHIFTFKKSPTLIDNVQENYCQIIIKYYDPKAIGNDNLKNTILSFRWAIDQKVDIINYSGGGTEASIEEKALVQEALNKGIKFVAAAGNERTNLSENPCNKIKSLKDKALCYYKKSSSNKYGEYYPAMYDKRIYVVGNLVTKDSRTIANTSNYGDPVNTWEVGTNVLSRLPGKTFGLMTGTSQATAVKAGKIVREMLLKK